MEGKKKTKSQFQDLGRIFVTVFIWNSLYQKHARNIYTKSLKPNNMTSEISQSSRIL